MFRRLVLIVFEILSAVLDDFKWVISFAIIVSDYRRVHTVLIHLCIRIASFIVRKILENNSVFLCIADVLLHSWFNLLDQKELILLGQLVDI